MLRPFSPPTHRFPLLAPFSTSTAARGPPPGVKFCKTKILDESSAFLRDGKLFAERPVLDFISRYGIEWDSSKMWYCSQFVATQMGVSPRFSDRHVLPPKDQKYMNPAGHPMRQPWLDRTAHRVLTEPLWVQTSVTQDVNAVVRIKTTRWLKSRLYAALERQGYDKYGRAAEGSGKRDLKGTLWLHVAEPLKVWNYKDREEFGPAMVRHLERLTGQKELPSRSGSARGHRKPGPQRLRNGNSYGSGTPSTRTFRPKD
jgi:hypothetical protein